jgi:Lon-like protease
MRRADGGDQGPPIYAAYRDRPWRRVGLALVCIGLVVAFFVVPIPIFYTYLPGPLRDVERLVTVSGARTYSSQGALLLTTVSVDVNVTAADLVSAALDPTKAVVPRDQVTGGRPLQRVERLQRQEMSASQQQAKTVALGALGLGTPKGKGARVFETLGGAPADGLLRPGDVILAIDGRPVATTCDVGKAIDDTDIGDMVHLQVRRDGRVIDVEVPTARNPIDPSSPFIGVQMEEVGYSFDPGVNVRFETGDIAGPSAGLMFTLGLYDRLTPGDLTGGRTIAGTGTIDCSGRVGPIGGIVQKVAAASARGAEVFLAPEANAADARSVAGDTMIVAVSNFDDALHYLEGSSS